MTATVGEMQPIGAIIVKEGQQMGKTNIEWCNFSWNPWVGCTEVSPACDHCYARVMMDDRYGRAKWGSGQARVRTSEANWKLPYRWNKAAAAAGRKDTVFCLSLGDIWDNEVSPHWRVEAFEVMAATPNLIWLLLSKRIGNANAMKMFPLPPNCALGATMVNQEEWDRDVYKLRDAGESLGALFTFASVEPMLGPIWMNEQGWCPDWVICGGESGPHARDMPEQWAHSLRWQTTWSGKKFFMKQMARKAPIPPTLLVRQYPSQISMGA